MDDKCLILHYGPTPLRVRKERFGCIMFDTNGVFVEGNQTAWEVLECIDRGFNYKELVYYLSESYCMPLEMINKDLNNLFLDFIKYGWLTNFEMMRPEE